VDAGRSRDRGGSGLGLAIARWALASNGGRIEVKSEPGHGSTFRLVFPDGSSEESTTHGEPPAA
jgi:signal transduction histidine kinase